MSEYGHSDMYVHNRHLRGKNKSQIRLPVRVSIPAWRNGFKHMFPEHVLEPAQSIYVFCASLPSACLASCIKHQHLKLPQ